MDAPRRTAPILATLLAASCYSGIGSSGEGTAGNADDTGGSAEGSADGGETEGEPPQLPACDPTLVPDETALRRLTKLQYTNTVGDLLRWSLGDADADSVTAALAPRFAAIPEDVRVQPAGQHLGGFRRLDQAVQQQHVDAGYRVAQLVAQALTAPERIAVAIGSCATDDDAANDDACVDDFLDRFGTRILRRPLFDDERVYYRAVFDAEGATVGMAPEAFADVIVALMLAPQFMYMVEHGGEPTGGPGDVYALTDFELASRLSYHFWQTMPDDALLDAAAQGLLSTPEGYAEQVDRLLADPRARAALAAFFHEWLWLDDVPAVGSLASQELYAAFVGDTPVDATTRENVIRETVDMALHYTFDEPGGLDDLMLSNRSFATTQDVASMYGTPIWDRIGEPPAMPQPERVGLLTRASRLVNATPSTRPIMKGVFTRVALLCDDLPPPPPNATTTLPALDAEMTTRERVTAITEQDESCAACHRGVINPLGFITEGYDALGRARAEETLFDQSGHVVGTRTVDTAAVAGVVPGDETVIDDPLELSDAILDSGKLELCFARHYLRFSFAREESLERDACALGQLTAQIDAGAPLVEVLRTIALDPTFRQRSFQ